MFQSQSEDVRTLPKSSKISQALRAIQPSAIGTAETENVAEPEVIIRPILGEHELDRVYQLTYDAYVERGYCEEHPSRRLIHYPHLDRIPETTVLVAVVDGKIVGTNSWTLDGPNGLHVDKDFHAETRVVRSEGRRLAASWRIATSSCFRAERKVVMALIQQTCQGIVAANVDTSIFTFNPRHERIYQRLLNMKTIATSAGTNGLRNAPAVLMRLDLKDLPERWLQPMSVG